MNFFTKNLNDKKLYFFFVVCAFFFLGEGGLQ